MSFNKNDYNYELPNELIAQIPLSDRASSRMLKLNREDGSIEHLQFRDIKRLLKKGDVLILNDSRVLPARIFGKRKTGALVEFLLLKKISINSWECLVKPGKKAKIGDEFSFGTNIDHADKFREIMKCRIKGYGDEGSRIVEFQFEGVFETILEELGQMPLPPYITEKLSDRERYQTVYSNSLGSSAAPTAGLHFTKELLKELKDMGVHIEYVTLHVGLGTFRPVKADNILEHSMHSEYYEISQKTLDSINSAKSEGRRVISVGTTSTRVIETVFSKGIDKEEHKEYLRGWTDIFIYPGYKFKAIDGLITNFHLPESTLIMLVSAFAGRDSTLKAYEEAVREKYRFFSFGDSMIIL